MALPKYPSSGFLIGLALAVLTVVGCLAVHYGTPAQIATVQQHERELADRQLLAACQYDPQGDPRCAVILKQAALQQAVGGRATSAISVLDKK